MLLPRIVAAGYAGVASPNLGELRDAIKSLTPEQQAEYYARFLDDKPGWPNEREWDSMPAQAGPREGQDR